MFLEWNLQKATQRIAANLTYVVTATHYIISTKPPSTYARPRVLLIHWLLKPDSEQCGKIQAAMSIAIELMHV